MKNLYNKVDIKTLLHLNIFSVIITAICEVFVIYILLTKGSGPDLERWKYLTIIGGLIIVSVFFVTSIVTLIYFMSKWLKQKKSNSSQTLKK